MSKEEMDEAAIGLIKEYSKRDDGRPVSDYDITFLLVEALDLSHGFTTSTETKIIIIALYKFEIEGFRA